jgi:hypothetical protein
LGKNETSKKPLYITGTLLVLALIGIVAWYQGPWSKVYDRTKGLVKKSEAHYSKAESKTQKLRGMDKTINAIRLSASKEDQDKIQKDIVGYRKKVAEAKAELRKSSDYLKEAGAVILPGWYRDYVDLLRKRNDDLEICLDVFDEEFMTLNKEIAIAPGLIQVVDEMAQVFQKLETIYMAYKADDFTKASEVIDQAESDMKKVRDSFDTTTADIKNEQHVKKTKELLEGIQGFFKTLRDLVAAATSKDTKAKDTAVKNVQMDSAVLDGETKALGLNTETDGWLIKQHERYKDKSDRAFSQALASISQADKILRKHK